VSQAIDIMRQFNPNAFIGEENGVLVMIEDVTDPDYRLYRIEYQSTYDGRHAIAYCRHNPWGTLNGGISYSTGHVGENGILCIGKDHTSAAKSSPYDLATAIQRGRYWCTAFSVLKETGTFPQPPPS
jgi:hypothetical protein